MKVRYTFTNITFCLPKIYPSLTLVLSAGVTDSCVLSYECDYMGLESFKDCEALTTANYLKPDTRLLINNNYQQYRPHCPYL